MYKQSFYNLLETDDKGRTILFNTKSGGVVVPESKDTDKFLSVLNKPSSYDKDDLMKKQLIESKYLIDDKSDELQELKEAHEKSIDNVKINNLGFIIVPTEYCNFACPYCFVYDYDRPSMPDEVYDGMYNAIVKKIAECKEEENLLKRKAEKGNKSQDEIDKIKVPTYVSITWFGGEPTMKYKQIISFMDRLLELEKKNEGLRLDAGMITNGYLLNYEMLKQFVDRKINFFQITLDGDKETHDQTRYLRGSKGATFDIIYRNLLEIKNKADKKLKFRISIRSNFMKVNIDSMKKLDKKFNSDFAGDDRFSNYFHQVYDSEKELGSLNNDLYTEEEGISTACRLNACNVHETLKKNPVDRMYEILPRPKSHPCFATANTYCVTVKGALFACESMIGEDDKAVGIINRDGSIDFNEENFRKWKGSTFADKDTYKNCFECKLMPVCVGGCRYNKLLNIMEGCISTEEVIREKMQFYLDEYLNKANEGIEKCYKYMVLKRKKRMGIAILQDVRIAM